jgi:hypothetical protein
VGSIRRGIVGLVVVAAAVVAVVRVVMVEIVAVVHQRFPVSPLLVRPAK